MQKLFPISCPLSAMRERPPQSPPRDTLRPRSPPDGVALERAGVRRKYRPVRSARRRPTDPERRHHHAPLTTACTHGTVVPARSRIASASARAMGTLGDGQDAGELDDPPTVTVFVRELDLPGGSRDSSVTLVLESEIPPRRRLQSTARRIALPRPSDTARPRSRRCSRPQTPGAPSESRCALDSRQPASRVPREHKARGSPAEVVAEGEAAWIDA
ncbi:uncharacterized protein TRAVEDRAFT_52292 [Trametes versicolor FP-101664 SS1]|uniref:uncharacterized protein n=1 Tax=Trametes versicolor (strain FP-101664) TaxID=717944 RepID=UPI0004622069|nr:uncharacterized protein TRAVEDRAFT_52292 [Trametes versicolor FP-101664 SS1]EIW53156.1 hypothetical protein TRAVEDRAFT_52292 [Trametes versicolor FP-101664 SS1]